MVASQHILAIDQGTTGTTALLMSTAGATLGRDNCEFPQHFPEPGWVEHEPDEIWESVTRAVAGALKAAGVSGEQIGAIGISNQRETTLLWNKGDDRPVHRAIVWQDRRTAPLCRELRQRGLQPEFQRLTGLVIDPYFAGTKLHWLLEHVPEARAAAESGRLAFGTVDSYLVWRLAGGAAHNAPHVTDVTNASRTLLMNLGTRTWDPKLCEWLSVTPRVLPRIVANAGEIARTLGVPGLPDGIVISGMAGDQHAALFGQACLDEGDAKCTYGTGAFVLVNTGNQPKSSRFGLLSTLGWQIGERVTYALEGSCFIAGAAVQWLRDGLGIIESSREVEALARSVPSSGGVVFVPALSGLGAPHWDPDARGLICGITRGTTRAHLARATLEAIAFEVNDLLSAMADDLKRPLSRMRVDGGAAANDLLIQFQSDISGISVERPEDLESTARGAAMLAGIGAGLFESERDASKMLRIERTFTVAAARAEQQSNLDRWREALNKVSAKR